MSDEKLMTVEEFDAALKRWARSVAGLSSYYLESRRKGTGELFRSFRPYVDPIKQNTGRRIAFKFARHGVFLHYGAGRGYVIINGQPVRGYRILSLREQAKGISNAEANEMQKRGYSVSHINRAKKVYSEEQRVLREPFDWLDGIIEGDTPDLVKISTQFYGDRSVAQLLNQIRKTKIVKVRL